MVAVQISAMLGGLLVGGIGIIGALLGGLTASAATGSLSAGSPRSGPTCRLIGIDAMSLETAGLRAVLNSGGLTEF